jgi:mycoredoxin
MAVTFYHVNWCPECLVVRERLDALRVPYEDVIVPDARIHRKQVFEVSGQYYVPVLKDGDDVFTETWEILEHLDRHYGKKDAAAGPSAGKGGGKKDAPAQLSQDDEYPSCER